MKKLLKNLTALLLVITLTLQFSVFATAQGKEATDDGTDIVYEIPEFRGEFEKHFQMADGTVVASTYAEPVNYYDTTDRTWKEIDNTLTQENGRYKNKGHGGFNVSFRGDNASGDLVEMSDGEYTLSWSVSVQDALGTKSTLKQQVNASVKERDNKEKDKFAADKAGSGMRYNSPFGGNKIIDVDYTVSQHKVKEDITIYSKRDANVVYYTYNCPSLTAVLTEDNSILFVNSENETVFTVHTPYMYDSEGNGSYEFDISIQQRGDTCTVVMTPNKEWLSSPDRAYPVVIDPTTTTNQATTNIVDTYVHQGDAAGDHYSETSMFIGLKNGVVHKGLIKFLSYPSFNAPLAEVKYAKLSLSLTGGTTAGGFSVYRLHNAWDDETVSYSTYPTSTLIASNVYPYFGTMKLEFDITSFYLNYAGTSSDYGLMVRYTDTTYNDYNSFYTSEYSNSAVRPVIIVAYDLTNETEANNDFTTADELVIDPYPGTKTPIRGVISSTSTCDYFKFTAPRHGEIEVSLSVQGGSYNTNYILTAHNITANNTLSCALDTGTAYFSTNDSNATSGYTSINFTALKDGDKNGSLDTYYLCVKSSNSTNLSYILTVKYTDYYGSLDWKYPLEAMRPGSAYYNTKATSPVGYRSSLSEYHQALDISANYGEILYAVTNGVICEDGAHYSSSGMGKYFVLWTGSYIGEDASTGETINYTGTQFDPFNNNNPYAIVYMHMSEKLVVEGEIVTKGQIIGKAGNSGSDKYKSHLHLEIYTTDDMPNSVSTTTAPNYECIVNPYDFFYDQVAFSGTPY